MLFEDPAYEGNGEESKGISAGGSRKKLTLGEFDEPLCPVFLDQPSYGGDS